MNKVILVGRLTKNPDVKYNKDLAIVKYVLAVDRQFKKDNDSGADFIRCVAFGKRGEFAEKYFHKGLKIAIEGRIQTSSYEKDGNISYSTDIIIENQEFVESKKEENTQDWQEYAENHLPFN